MRKYSWLSIVFTFLSLLTLAQELPYAFQQAVQPVTVINGSGFPVYTVNEVFVDAAGNTYATGFFKGTCDFDPGPAQVSLISPNVNDEDAFLAKYAPSGALLYVKAITGTGSARGNDVLVTAEGKVFVVGQFSSSVNLDPSASNFTIGSMGGTDGFFARFDAETGDFETAVSNGGSGNDALREVARSGSFTYVSGTFQGTVDFDLSVGTYELTAPASTTQYYVNSYGDAFELIWAHGFASSSNVYSITSIASDATGVYLTGAFAGTVDFDPNAATLSKTSAGSNDVWISKFDNAGNLLWNQTFGGSGIDIANDLALDASSNVFVTGQFTLTTDLDPSGVVLNATSAGDLDAYLSKFDSNGNFAWARTWGGVNADYSYSVASLATGSVVIGGRFNSPSFDADPGAGTTTLTRAFGDSDGYFSAFNTSGALQFAYSFGSTNQSTSGNFEDAQVRSNGDQLFTLFGSFNHTIDFDPTSDVGELTAQYTDFQQGYIARYTLLSTLPAAQPTTLVLNNQTGSSIDISFTGSGANGYLVVRRSNAASTAQPKDGVPYTTGSFLNDAVVAYAGASTSFTDVGLAANTNYFYTVYAFNNTAGAPNYLASTPLTGNSATTSITYSRTTDSLALVALYNSTNGAGWTNNTNWLSGYINTWNGVKMTGDRVTKLTLGSNLLTGTLPPTIGNLTSLDTLELWSNQLTGNIPTELGNLAALQYLDLSPNQFTGNIPDELGNLSLLQTLWINHNKLTGPIPAALGNLSSLQNLYMQNNQLSGSIPPQLGNLTSLSVLEISNNLLSGNIPIELGNLTSLITLELNGNKLTGNIPVQLSTLAALITLRLDQNQLSGGIPIELGTLGALQNLYLNSNLFTGSIPSQLGNLSSLIFMDLGGNQLTGTVPVSIFSIPGLQTLGIAGNQLTGSIPVEITNATNLVNFWADNNQFTGAFPAMTSSTNPAIDGITIGRNQLTDLPDLSTLNGLLSYFDVFSNNFTFEDLEPNAGIGGINYAPQNNVGVADTLNLNINDPLNLPYTIGGSANIYTWRLGSVVDPTQTTGTLSIATVTPDDAGRWQLQVTNSGVPGLTISTNVVLVNVLAESIFEWISTGAIAEDGINATTYGGIAGDFNNDGFDDLYTINLDTIGSRLFQSVGDGTFTDVTASLPADDGAYSSAWGDYDNDGDLDLFASDVRFTGNPQVDGVPNIYRNDGGGVFTASPISVNGAFNGSWGDMDRDGDLDLIIGGSTTYLYRNDGGDVFTQTTPFLGLSTGGVAPLLIMDINKDGKPDLIAQDVVTTKIKVFIQEGILSFYESYIFELTDGSPVLQPWGITQGDIDNDGDADLFVSEYNIGGTDSYFYLNDGTGNFTATPAATLLGEVLRGGRASTLADFNNDGYLDLLANTRTTQDPRIFLYLNDGDGTFTKESNQTFAINSPQNGVTVFDLNNDGFLDVYAPNALTQLPNAVYRNKGNSNNYIRFKLNGTTSNRSGIGAHVQIFTNGIQQSNYVTSVTSTSSQNSYAAQLNFGLGSSTTVDSIVVAWPSGYQQILMNQSANQILQLNEPVNPISTTDMTLIAAYQIQPQNSTSSSWVNDFMLDSNDNLITIGSFNGIVDFNPGPGTNLIEDTSIDAEDYVSSYTLAGDLRWIRTFPTADYENQVSHEAVYADGLGNVYIGGGIRGTFDVNPGAGVNNLSSNVGAQEDPYFAKYDINGNFLWAKQLLSTTTGTDASVKRLALDAVGNILIAGDFSDGSIDMDPDAGTATLTSTDISKDIFLAKYDANGNYLWAIKIGSDGPYEFDTSITTDSQNNIYLTYSIEDSNSQAVISKYNSSGVLLWSATSTNTFYSTEFRSLKLDEASNRLYITGTYQNAPSFLGTSGSSTLPAAAANTWVGYVAAFDLNGAFITVFPFQTSNDSYPVSVNVLSDGNLIITGGYSGTVDLDPSSGVYESYYPDAAFFTKISPSGTFLWASSIPYAGGILSTLSSQGELLGILIYENTTVDVDPGAGVVNLTGISANEEIGIIRYNVNSISVTPEDKAALEALYAATGGPNWTNQTNWLSPNVSTWYGVKVVGNRVTDVRLENNNLTGALPVDIGGLTAMDTLNLGGNQLSGELPVELGNLTALTSLSIGKNNFSGNVPTSLANLINLTGCALEDNSFTSLPNLSTLPNLTYCNISGNQFTFETLEPNVGITGITYSPQDSIGMADTVLIPTNQAYAMSYTIGGSANVYQWRRNGTAVSGATSSTFTLSTPTFANEGLYHLETESSLVPNLTLYTRPILVKVSSLERDSLALAKLFEATNGSNWINNSNWTTTPLATGNWFGVTVTANRVTQVNLQANNLQGAVPPEFADLEGVTDINLSDNLITSIPTFTTYPSIVTLNVANNKLDFGSLENNRALTGIDFSDQQNLEIAPDTILVASGEDYILKTSVRGSANTYQWKRAGVNVEGSVADSLVIQNIGRANMGQYVLEVKNTLIPTLTLTSEPVDILATANLSGKLFVTANPATAGIVRLLRVTSSNGYDTVRIQNVNATGDYAFNQVVLDDYQIVGFADTLVVGQERALPTYYESTIYWEEADTLFVENSLSDLNIISLLEPTEPLTGSGEISGVLQEDDGTGSRIERTRRVGGAGVSARRAQSAGRGAELGELVAYVFTDEEGLFSMPGLTPGVYRINIQYPGYPMDPNSFIDITIGTSPLDERISVEALVAEGKITVRELVITHLEGDYVANVYPNPTSGHVTITFDKIAYERTLTLMDTQGRIIMQQKANERVVNMDMNALEPGLYLMKVIDGGHKVKTIRVSVQ